MFIIFIDWPENRSVFIAKDFIILINFLDHFKLVTTGDLDKIYNNANELIKAFEKYLNFENDKTYGYVNSSPLLLGSGLEIYTEVKLDNIDKYRELVDHMQFDSITTTIDNTYKIRSFYKLAYKNESNFVIDFYTKISGLINLDLDGLKLNTLTLNKLAIEVNPNFQDSQYIKAAYEETYEEYKHTLSACGNHINHLIQNYLTSNELLFSDENEYKTFEKFVHFYIKKSQNFDIYELDHIHKPDEHKGIPKCGNNKSIAEIYQSMKITLIRNIENYPFVRIPGDNSDHQVEDIIMNTVQSLNTFKARYYKNRDDVAVQEELNKLNEKIDLSNLKDRKNIGVIVFEGYSEIYAIVNDIDHIKFILVCNTVTKLDSLLIDLLRITNEFSSVIKFVYDKRLGFLTASPRFVGTGLSIETILKLESNFKDRLENIIEKENYTITALEESKVILKNKNTIGKSETDLLSRLIWILNELNEFSA